jgi:ankyrin repeat protein
MCRLLVSHGAQLDSRNGVRETPMHIAIQHNHIQAAEFFFNHVWQMTTRHRDETPVPDESIAANPHPVPRTH